MSMRRRGRWTQRLMAHEPAEMGSSSSSSSVRIFSNSAMTAGHDRTNGACCELLGVTERGDARPTHHHNITPRTCIYLHARVHGTTNACIREHQPLKPCLAPTGGLHHANVVPQGGGAHTTPLRWYGRERAREACARRSQTRNDTL